MKVFSSVRKTLALAMHYFRFNASAAMAYRASFFIQVIGMILNDALFIVFWLILYARIGSDINGYEFRDVMFLWSLSAGGFGIATILAGNSSFISRIIYSGELDVYLLQPKPVLINLLGARMSVASWGDLIYGVVLFIITQPLTPVKILLFLFFMLLLAMVFTAVRVLYHSLTFFLGNSEEFANIMSELNLSFGIYPGSIFKGPVLWILHTIIPVGLMVYLPVKLFQAFDPLLCLLMFLGDMVIVFAAFTVFYLGLRMYESGNRMGTRL